MTASYIRSFDEEKKFRDRRGTNNQGESVAIDFDADPEYASYKDEKQNIQKMSSVLKQIQETGVPKKKRLMSA